jgi:hypothetical protein
MNLFLVAQSLEIAKPQDQALHHFSDPVKRGIFGPKIIDVIEVLWVDPIPATNALRKIIVYLTYRSYRLGLGEQRDTSDPLRKAWRSIQIFIET